LTDHNRFLTVRVSAGRLSGRRYHHDVGFQHLAQVAGRAVCGYDGACLHLSVGGRGCVDDSAGHTRPLDTLSVPGGVDLVFASVRRS
jgi:hypothetical protein